MGARLNAWGRGLIGTAMVLALASCGHPAVSAPASAVRANAPVEAAQWYSPWLPTMKTLSVPALDFASLSKRAEAKRYVETHEQDWQHALARFDDGACKQAQAVRDAVKGDELGEAALMRLVPAGKLSTAIAGLATLAAEPLGTGLDRRTLVAETLAELEEPGRIIQGVKWTCESASVQILIARRDPAEYVRLVAGLASSEGAVKLASGEAIARVSDWSSKTDGWRSLPSRLIQPAFATYGNAPLPYSNTHDRNSKGESGLTDAQLTKLLTAVFGRPFRCLSQADSTPAERMAAYREALAKGWESPVWLNWFSGHVVLAEQEADGRVVIDNPLGAIHSLTAKAFQDALHSVYVPQ